jgi:F-type H+-transporting ATPase subunit a
MHCTFAADLKKAFPDMAMTAFRKYWIVLIFSGLSTFGFAQHDPKAHPTETTPNEHPAASPDNQHPGDQSGAESAADHSPCASHSTAEEEKFNAGDNAVHHIADANAIHIFGDLYLHLPVILYAPGSGWTTMTTAAFHPHHHANGTLVKDGYVLVHGNVMRIQDPAFPKGEVAIEGEPSHETIKDAKGKEKILYYVKANGNCYALDNKSTLDGGVMGGGITSFYDFSITRNVFTMLLTVIFLFLLFRSVAVSAIKNRGHAPKGLQNFMEPLVTFIRDEVAKPNIGPKYEKYMPYLLSAFFFILGLNLIGQVPFFPGSANVTGNISVTIVLAILTFLVTNLSGNRNYWGHILWMPGIPAALKILITPLEILGVFLKPLTLLLRLFANISAGHIVILSFVSLIFILGKAGESVGGSVGGIVLSVPLTLFMSALELLVAFLQAFIFVMLSSTYIGAAVEEHHH